MSLAACDGGQRIATFTHDLGGAQTLHAYLPEPAAETRQGEQIANKLYGFLETRSPQTPYICVWRDTDPARFPAKADAGPPHEILLTCKFGASAWHPPANLVQHAEEAMRRDQAQVAINWTRRGMGYVITRLELAVTNFAANRDFRSVWYDEDEIARLHIEAETLVFPTSPADSFEFSIRGSLPRRYNEHEAATAATATFAMAGTAPPIPDWVLY